MSSLTFATPILLVLSALASQATPSVPTTGIPPIVWELASYTVTNGEPVDVTEPARYTLQFLPDGLLSARLDCNQGSGGYTANDGALTLTPMAATLKLCEPDSQVDAFTSLLHDVTSYRFDPDGSLLLQGDAGALRLQPAL